MLAARDVLKIVVYGVLLALFARIFIGGIVELTIERKESELVRVGTLLLENFLAHPKIVVWDEERRPLGLALNQTALDTNLDFFSNNFPFPPYEYKLSISLEDREWEVKNYEGRLNEIFSFDSCYTEVGMGISFETESWVSICEGKAFEDCKLGKIKLSLVETPLGRLASSIVEACEINPENKVLVKTIRFKRDEISEVKIEKFEKGLKIQLCRNDLCISKNVNLICDKLIEIKESGRGGECTTMEIYAFSTKIEVIV